MAIETLESCEASLWSDSLFAANDGLTSKLGSGEVEWDIEDMKEFWNSFDVTDFNNDLQFEVMNTEVSSQTVVKGSHDLDLYHNSTAFLSPVSMAPSSPADHHIEDNYFEQHLQCSHMNEVPFESPLDDTTSAIELLNKILSAGSDDTDGCTNNSAEFIDDNTLSAVQYFSNDEESTPSIVGDESDRIDEAIDAMLNQSNAKAKRQTKRKAETSSRSPNKRSKRSKTVSTEVKKERKKGQNKMAANRYRQKKRAEQEVVEAEMNEQLKRNENLKQALEKLQMEYKVVSPLANAAFAADPKRQLVLQMLQIRVLNDNLLD